MGSPTRAAKAPRPSRRVMKTLLTPVGLDAPERIVLPPVLGLKEAGAVREQFLAMRGKAVEVDGSQVERLGGLGLQVLLSARATWRQDGQPLRFVDPSEAFGSGITLFGAASLTATHS